MIVAALDQIEKWLVDKVTVIKVDMVVAQNKRQVDQETTIASGVKCRFDKSGGSLEQTMLGQQRIVARKVFFLDTPEIKPTYRIVNEATGEKFTVLDAFHYHDAHQEAHVERVAS